MNVLSVIHSDDVRSGVFGDVIAGRGHALDEWSVAWGKPMPRPLRDYGAVLVFGGAMHVDQEDRHPWLREEDDLIREVLRRELPLLGVCLGAQLVAKAADAEVGPALEPEVGWFPVELTPAAAEDPVFSRLPRRFDAMQWHYYTYTLPSGAEELARSAACTQAFRLGRAAWGIQFHAEVTQAQVEGWLAGEIGDGLPTERITADTAERIGEWNRLGRDLCSAFVEVAERG